ncbi:MAG: PorT family protein [Chitinophagaceae bacterium]|nr:PorT family protein [Chitinophagaceae bacterium]
MYTTSYSQVSLYPDKGSITGGITGGLSNSTVTVGSNNSSNPLSPASRTGFNAGIFADFYFSDRWSLKTVLGYTQKGWKNPPDFEDGNYNLNYITIPVMANWHFGKTRNWYLNFGPYVGILTSANATKISDDLKPYFNSADFGLDIGIGVRFPISDNVRLHLEINGAASFGDIFKNNTSGYSVNNSTGTYNIGFEFPLK